MGITADAVRFLICARQSGVSFENFLTVGRQNLMVSAAELSAVCRQLKVAGVSEENIRAVVEPYADQLLKLLGAQRVESLDYSPYEGATVIHDLNQPIPPELKETFDVVYDGGSLEHVFNFPVAVKNCMEMVKVGGHLILHTPANNYFGHGFYQFSAELFYRILAPDNGYQIKRLIAAEDVPPGRWYEVADSKTAQSRVQLVNDVPVSLLILAQRVERSAIFDRIPQEYNYEVAWTKPPRRATTAQPARQNSGVRAIKQVLQRVSPALLARVQASYGEYRRRRREAQKNKRKTFQNRNIFRLVNKQRLRTLSDLQSR
ncbi:MAG: hypothetical protein HZC41_24165 [Chloroflexi bacterium]|nr:hypothetical protein [Chloroflexota bacterium]